MSAEDQRGPGGASDPHDPTGEPVGNVGEEAAKLFGALADWARDQGGELGHGVGDGISGLAGAAAAGLSEVNDHIATGSAECRYCPVCRTVHAVRQASPEVRAHLTTAASSFLQAAAGVLASMPPPSGSTDPSESVERIDLDDDHE